MRRILGLFAAAMLAGCAGSVGTVSTPSSMPASGSASTQTPASGFGVTGSLTVERTGHAAALLNDGRVLIVGGSYFVAHDTWLGQEYRASAELYDPATGTFSLTEGAMETGRYDATATLLPNGKVLVAGGCCDDSLPAPDRPLASAELYDPASGSFTATGSMANARSGHTATLLADGRVLIVGGTGLTDATLASAELYDPATGRFVATGSMATSRTGHAAAMLEGGWVVVTGGIDSNAVGNAPPLASAEWYDPTSGEFTGIGSMTTGRSGHTATALGGQRILICGGLRAESSQAPTLDTCELYDALPGNFEPVGRSMSSGRTGQAAVLLAGGRVLILGGREMKDEVSVSYPAKADLYDPAAGGFSSAGSLSLGRTGATATLLSDGRVLIVGGMNGDKVLASAELYRP